MRDRLARTPAVVVVSVLVALRSIAYLTMVQTVAYLAADPAAHFAQPMMLSLLARIWLAFWVASCVFRWCEVTRRPAVDHAAWVATLVVRAGVLVALVVMFLHASVRAQFVIAPLLVVFGQYLLLARLFVWRESPARCRVGAGMAGAMISVGVGLCVPLAGSTVYPARNIFVAWAAAAIYLDIILLPQFLMHRRAQRRESTEWRETTAAGAARGARVAHPSTGTGAARS